MYSAGSSEVVPAYIFVVGHSDRYIIAKQHPTSGFYGGYEINTSITNYYVIDMARRDLQSGNEVYGPLRVDEFDSLRTALGIENIPFDMNYPQEP